MKIHSKRFVKACAPLIAVGLLTLLSGCDKAHISIDGEDGKPLSELDMSGAAPHGLVLLGPDTVNITTGDKLAITVEGDKALAENLRFTLKDGTLGVLRKDGMWSSKDSVTVHVTMPAPDQLTMSGSGKIKAATLAKKAEVTIAGSGDVETNAIAADKLEVTIAGSGSYRANGQVAHLDMNIAGSGNANMEGLKAEKAEISIAGSGSSRFASDGEVKANIMGSGEVRVSGRASCTVSALGSGKLICEPGNGPVRQEDADKDDEKEG
jgi:Putative auto-transporter adhesin, head GIN domain